MTLFKNKNFVEQVHLLIKLHELYVKGMNESDEAETLREESDGHWYSFTEYERLVLCELSKFLYEVGDYCTESTIKEAVRRFKELHTKERCDRDISLKLSPRNVLNDCLG